jgi:peptidoglycan hydrolase-like protein with peptidoglycan-binding domain
MGFGPYGDYWSFNNSGIDANAPLGNDVYVSDSQVQQLLQANPSIVPVFDPTYQSEIFMTNEYVNSSGQWTVNPNGSAVAPTQTLSTSDQNTYNPQVVNLQGLLNYILVRWAVENNQPVPSYLNLTQDGKYGSLTAQAVTQFQQDFNVAGATPGTYDQATQAALTQVIQQWNIGEYQYWLDTTQSMQNRVQQVAIADQLGGMAVWRVPFETSDFWSTLQSTVTVAHSTGGGTQQP